MVRSHLRVYYGPESSTATVEAPADESQVRVRLGHILPLLADAVSANRTWLRDFDNDEVTLPSDLYEVLLAYQHCRRPVA